MPSIFDPSLDKRFQAVFLRGHLRLLAAGMKNSRLSGTSILKKASALTGTPYKRGQYRQALDDLQAIIDSQQKGEQA